MRSCEYWRLIDTGSGLACENMAIDEALLENCNLGDSAPVLHFYTWKSLAITLGYLQDLHKTVRISQCRARGVEIVRRTTGGRAVVHDQDLGFSLIFPAKGRVIPPGIGPSYLKIAQGFIRGLSTLGIDAYLADGRSYQGPCSLPTKDISACFLTRIKSEVLFSGRKLVGCAQRRIGGWVLQQGTLMLDLDRAMWAELLNYPIGLSPMEFMERLDSQMTSIREICGEGIDLGSIKKALIDGMSVALGVKFETTGLYPFEKAQKDSLVRGKYSDLLRKNVLC